MRNPRNSLLFRSIWATLLFWSSAFIAQSQSLKVNYIANEGVLLQWQNQKVLIDAIHRPYSPYYTPTPDTLLDQMMAGVPPFDDVDVLLISHVHGDHFHAATIAQYLAFQPGVKIVGAPQMRDSLEKASADFSKIADQIVAPAYEAGKEHLLNINGISINLYDLAHGSTRNHWVENLASIITMGTHKIMHLGDPDLNQKPFKAFSFPAQNISLGLLPDWFLTSKEGQHLVNQYITPEQIIAVHVSPQWEAESRRKMKQYFPKARLFTQPMEFQIFE